MSSKERFTARASVFINVPVTQVWDALTKPQIIRRYFFNTQAETDWKVGSPIRFYGDWQGKSYEDKGTILENVHCRTIRYSYWSSLSGDEDKPENYLIISYDLKGDDAGTLLEITQENLRDEHSRENSENNWSMVLANMKSLLEDSNRVPAF